LVLPAGQSLAAKSNPLSEHYFFQEVPVVLSATRLPQQLSDIPAAVTIIDKQMIKASGALEIDGVELQITYRPSDRTLLYFGCSIAGMTGEEARQISAGGAFSSPRKLGDKMANYTASLLASHRFNNGIQVSMDSYFLDDITWKGEGDPLPSCRRWDLHVSKDFRFPDSDGEIALVLQNINGSHLEFREDNEEETGAYLQLELNYR
jgi:hypothetical protein